MATSGTYNYNPSLGELTLYAYNLAGIRNTALLQEHMETARMASNLLLANWSNRGVNLWQVDLVSVPMTTSQAITQITGDGTTATVTYPTPNTPIYTVGQNITILNSSVSNYNVSAVVTASGAGYVSFANTTTGTATGGTISTTNPASTYSVNPNTVMILDGYMAQIYGNNETDRYIMPISRSEYASYPNKYQNGFPTTYWFDRLLSPQVTLWPVPNGSEAFFKYYRVIQVQDSEFTSGQQVDIPYLWLDAFAYGLAHRISEIWMPAMAPALEARADKAYTVAAEQNVEYAQQYFSPQIAGYFR